MFLQPLINVIKNDKATLDEMLLLNDLLHFPISHYLWENDRIEGKRKNGQPIVSFPLSPFVLSVSCKWRVLVESGEWIKNSWIGFVKHVNSFALNKIWMHVWASKCDSNDLAILHMNSLLLYLHLELALQNIKIWVKFMLII